METHPNHTPLHHHHNPSHDSRSNIGVKFSLLVLGLTLAFVVWTITTSTRPTPYTLLPTPSPRSNIQDLTSKIQTQAAEPLLMLNLRTGEIEAKKIMLKDMNLADEIDRLKKDIEELKRNR